MQLVPVELLLLQLFGPALVQPLHTGPELQLGAWQAPATHVYVAGHALVVHPLVKSVGEHAVLPVAVTLC